MTSEWFRFESTNQMAEWVTEPAQRYDYFPLTHDYGGFALLLFSRRENKFYSFKSIFNEKIISD